MTAQEIKVTTEKAGMAIEPAIRAPWMEGMQRLLRQKTAIFGLIIVCILLLTALLAPLLAPYDPVAPDLPSRLQAPSATHFLGTDELGRDILSRIIYGSRISIQVGLLAVGISLIFGTFLGAISGYFGGKLDMAIMRVIDIVMAFPYILLAIAITAMLGPGLNNAMIAIGVVGIPIYARVVRGAVLSVKEMEYIEAAKVSGCGSLRIIMKHVLPNCLAPLIVQATLGIGTAILDAAGLSFLGLGAQPPTPEWGIMLNKGKDVMNIAPWVIMFPGIAILFTVLGFNLLGDGLRDALDPRLRNNN
ncbi:peptide/nickel transport system permease protein [Desulfotomaculum arcticum]|uniref:Peptide/nickel transport system permease protein n=1 Tax=Desulfotruncus arcticus DSM 17038 TaxID=1121424 RepID=A0A1I2TKG3_9FIRM|nr:nickel transporter permease [Desulfotruncus arcticus]SFG65303.1 peptide/nickel transport system permease protein [Desulfotomaculum arcticum] [Desulfotruncus arcticus DSM 17038]